MEDGACCCNLRTGLRMGLADGAFGFIRQPDRPYVSTMKTGTCFTLFTMLPVLLPPSKPPAPAFQPFRYILTAIPLSDRYSLRSLISSSL